MTLMMTSSNDDKSDIYFIPYCQYSMCTKFRVKWTKIFWDTACFFNAGLLVSPQPGDFQKSPAQIWLTQLTPVFFALYRIIIYILSQWVMRTFNLALILRVVRTAVNHLYFPTFTIVLTRRLNSPPLSLCRRFGCQCSL